MSTFENLSDEIIISIIEYLSLEDYISIFGELNTRLACIIFDHPWTERRLNIQMINDDSLKKKLDFIENMSLTSRISSIHIRPFSIYRSINTFNQHKSLESFENLKSLSLNNVTLGEVESIFTRENLSKLNFLTRLRLIFSLGVEETDYSSRFESFIAQILTHQSLRYCTIHTARSVDFSQLKSSCPIEYLDIDYCSFQSLYNLFEFTPHLRHLIATIAVMDESKTEPSSPFPLLYSLKLNLSIPTFDYLPTFFEKLHKLQKLHVVTYSIIEPLDFTSSWFKLITDHLPELTKFKRESNVPLENIAEYIESFHWPNGWQSKEKSLPNGSIYSRMTIVNTRY